MKRKILVLLCGILLSSPVHAQRMAQVVVDGSGSFQYLPEAYQTIRQMLGNAAPGDVFIFQAMGGAFNPNRFFLAKFPSIPPPDLSYSGFTAYKRNRLMFEAKVRQFDRVGNDAYTWVLKNTRTRGGWTDIPQTLSYAAYLFRQFNIEDRWLFLITDLHTQLPDGTDTYDPPPDKVSWAGTEVFILFADYNGKDSSEMRWKWRMYFKDAKVFYLLTPAYSEATDIENFFPSISFVKTFPPFRSHP